MADELEEAFKLGRRRCSAKKGDRCEPMPPYKDTWTKCALSVCPIDRHIVAEGRDMKRLGEGR